MCVNMEIEEIVGHDSGQLVHDIGPGSFADIHDALKHDTSLPQDRPWRHVESGSVLLRSET
jgi:hypothetical protein